MKLVIYLLILIIIPLLLNLILFIITNILTAKPTNCSIHLFIGIISSRNNFDKRQSIRKSWFQTIHNISDSNFQLKPELGLCEIQIKAKFIIGDKDCRIHPLFRTNPYNCNSNTIKFKQNESQIYLHHLNESNSQNIDHKLISSIKPFRGFSFVIRHSIIITKIGVHKNFLNANQNVTVVLLNAINKHFITSVNISFSSNPLNEVYYESVKSITLPKHFYGLLSIDNQQLEFNGRHQSINLQNQNGFLHVLRAYLGFSDFESIPYNRNLIIGPTLAYSVADPKSIQLLIDSENENQMEWNREILRIKEKVFNETLIYDDIVLIDLIDIYRNIPEKVVRSLQFAIKFQKYTHFLKTDDDCYLNINNIIHQLANKAKINKVWFGNFRRLWPLDYYGKWAENDYGSPFYPPFACGSGYILTADLAQWLTSNIDHLHRFQGEDVSMGIWLSAINPNYNDDNRWLCNRTENNIKESFSIPQLDEKQIIKIHNFIVNE